MFSMGTHYLERVWIVQWWSQSVKVTHHDSHSETHLSDNLHGIYWFLSMGKPNISSLPTDGSCDSFNYLSDNIHLSDTAVEQRLEYCTLFSCQIGPEYYHTHDGSNLSRLLSFLRLNKHWGNETLHFSSLKCSLFDPNDNCLEECDWNSWLAESLTTSHTRKRYWNLTASC